MLLVGLQEVADKFNISQYTVSRYVSEGMPYVGKRIVGKALTFDSDIVAQWLQDNNKRLPYVVG